jgi:hypothetical protein
VGNFSVEFLQFLVADLTEIRRKRVLEDRQRLTGLLAGKHRKEFAPAVEFRDDVGGHECGEPDLKRTNNRPRDGRHQYADLRGEIGRANTLRSTEL